MSKRPDTRTVHASSPDMELVRYERQGHWYIEPRNRALPRQKVCLADAVKMAHWWVSHANGVIHYDRPGGVAFNRKARRTA